MVSIRVIVSIETLLKYSLNACGGVYTTGEKLYHVFVFNPQETKGVVTTPLFENALIFF